MTFVLVIFAEVLPKTYAINRPTRTSLAIAPILTILIRLLSPFVKIINFFVKILLKNLTKKVYNLVINKLKKN